MNYKVKVDGNEIEYGTLIEKSNFTEKEWSAIYAEVVKQNQPSVYKKRKADIEFINTLGALISLEERYEALLDLLPQEEFSYAGTHPKWVADAVEENTLDKETTKDDVASLLEQCETLEDLKEGLVDYFELEDLE
ncbi:TPA: hypothetical protein TYI17_002263 [Streptococcus suis]|uniref:hypothetical protein n=1 Tax=Streptococcus suis TaxID=1307 RepID=UPI0009433EC9|nr:hypothetical protein [Streptococcus suis]NQK20078.1 hypothetical protein [Streptococcus suis]HEL1931445.1 hypothetical protein [Streptococcus suis]HEL1932922.1 hypothetical protein [Streptococcus suis]HEL2449504.1 hypothetical protein [Streptococcus suis]